MTGLLAAAASTLVCVAAPAPGPDQLTTSVRAAGVPVPPSAPAIGLLDSGVGVEDREAHGTRAAGIAAELSPTSRLIPIRIVADDGSVTADSIAHGIDSATAQGARIIEIGVTAPANPTPDADDRMIEAAVDRAVTRGVLVVAPTGNDGSDDPTVPADYPHVLGVGATDESDRHARFSNGGTSVDLSAPGVDLTAPVPPGFCSSGFALATGTSFAAPAVAGVAARVEAVRPTLKPGDLGELLRASARPIGDPEAGAGIVDLTRALTQPAPPADAAEVDDSANALGTHRPFRIGRRTGTVRAGEDPADSYTIVVGRGARPRFTTRGHVVVRRRRLNARRWLLSVEPAHGESTLVRYVLNVRGRKP